MSELPPHASNRAGKKDLYEAPDYFQGFPPDASSADDVTHNFGDPQEASFASAIKYLTQGTFTSSVSSVKVMGKSVSTSSVRFMDVDQDESFKGMIETRVRVKN